VRLLYSLFFKCKYKERCTLCGVSFDTMECMVAIKYILLYYYLKITLPCVILNYGTNTMLKNGTPSPPNGPVFNITQ
jgi:hypothetical protein